MNLDEALKTFIVESRDLLREMETALLGIESGEADDDAVNAIFRAAHTIKGTAGVFAIDHMVEFTHGVESVLDQIRSGSLKFTPDLVNLLLDCNDHLVVMVDLIESGASGISDGLKPANETLIIKLRQYYASESKSMPQSVAVAVNDSLEKSGGGEQVETDNWHISLRFGPDVLRNGMDPLSFLRYLQRMGKIVAIHALAEDMPSLEEMDAESCYLGFEIAYSSDATKEKIESVFDFVRDDAEVRILPPRSRISLYIDLIRALPEDDVKLGELLTACGTLTRYELEQALKTQESRHASIKLGAVLVEEKMVQPPVVEAALEKQKNVRDAKSLQSKGIRIDADKLDHLINLVGELVIAGAGAANVAQRSGNSDMLEAAFTISRLIEEVRDGALMLRMVQIGETFNRFQRVVRDIGKDIGKDVRLVIKGAETELDKTVIEQIGDPLMHLVRNSMDHGIEPSEVRRQRGKPEYGTVMLNAFHESGSIVIEVSDDGGGLNKEKVIAKAIERGIISSGQTLTDQEAYQLIFEPGFSTAEKVTNLSGRGVGMDVVRKNIEALRGAVEVDSQPGTGTMVRIRLPLTLAIIDGFLVGVAAASFVIPLDMVVECVELSDADRSEMRGSHYLNLRGEVLPFIRLRELFDIDGEVSRRENVVVVQYAGHKAGLLVDRLMGEFQTVIKPMGQLFRHLKGISGSTILGSGEVALILDVPTLIQLEINVESHTGLSGKFRSGASTVAVVNE